MLPEAWDMPLWCCLFCRRRASSPFPPSLFPPLRLRSYSSSVPYLVFSP
ncbi:hypothetical protein L249_6459 [Ophiocordyceps polyrhachis-furcata BCC 54312]|uniref:Uncharacterized protein n=1 Tax=Ophiocordyceps polyrhachis-furcata BCC 54312 TaxID=1330021 RepID=A0A367LK14_9HYPO|nr:hypothetical protein L249_6459 [Ophiocordyceps polyrhachis-furcata BCC 54312]